MLRARRFLNLLTCIGCVTSFRKGENRKKIDYDLSMFAWAVDTGHRFQPSNISECQWARKVSVSAMKTDGGAVNMQQMMGNGERKMEGERKDLVSQECVRCRQGFIELPQLTSIHFDDFEWYGYLQRCVFQPCGEACSDCFSEPHSFRKLLGKPEKTSYSCRRCRSTSLKHTYLASTPKGKSIVTSTGGKMSIKAQCLPFLNFGDTSQASERLSRHYPGPTPAVLTVYPIISRLIRPPSGKLSHAEINPFEFISLIETCVMRATQEFQASSGGSLVGDGEKFLARLIQEGLDKFKADDKANLGRTLSQSSVITDTRRTLKLCRDISMVKIGSTQNPSDDERWEASLKRCTAIELVLSLLRQYTTEEIDEVQQGTMFSDENLSQVPRRMLVMLQMFDGMPS